MALVFDLADPAALTLAGRQLPFPQGVFWQWLPATPRDSAFFKYTVYDNSYGSAAPIRPWNTPAVPMDRPGELDVMGQMLPISVINWLLEDESQRLRSIRNAGDTDANRVEAVFQRALKRLSDGVRQRIMLMQGEAVSKGTVTLGTQAAPENRVQAGVIDFGIPASNLFTASTLWDASTPGILSQLTTWSQVYRDTTGNAVVPGVMVTSTRVLNAMLNDPELRTLAGSILGTPTSIGPTQLNSILADRQLPRLIVDDSKVRDTNGVLTREFADNKVVLLPETPANGGFAVGATQWGVTEEARELADARIIPQDQMPGLVAVPMKDENPVQTGLLVTAVAMPVVTAPDLIMSVNVLAP